MKKLLFVLVLLASGAQAFGQGFGFSGSPVVNGMGQPIAGASVAISTANPCGTSPTYTNCNGHAQGSYSGATPPAALATLYTDITVATTTPNPLTTDAFGNWTAYLAGAGSYWVTVYGPRIRAQVFFAGSAGTGANAIQGVPVAGPITLVPGVSLVIDSTGTTFTSLTPYDIDSRFCGLPTDNTTDAFQSLKDCVNNHPGAHIRLWKTAAASGVCDYKISQSIYLLGAGQWIDGTGSGPNTNQPVVRVCTSQVGVPGFIGTNQMAPGFKISNIAIVGQEAFTRTSAATFVYPFGQGYPGFQWQTATASAGGLTITLNGTNEAWTAQTDNKIVQVLGGGAPAGTVSIATTINNYTGTCTCTRDMIGKTVAIAGAGPGGGILYAHIIGLVGTNPPVTGNAYLDQKPAATVGAAVSQLSFDYYGTLGTHTTAASSPVSPAFTSAVTNSYIYVGSAADGIRGYANFAKIENVAVSSFGRNGMDVSNSNAPYIQTGGGSNLSDNVQIINPLIQLNRGSGINCAGGDCNVNKFVEGTISQNQGWGVDDSGFLINTIDSINTAGNHNDCTVTPCPSIGGSSAFKNSLATWLDGVPYATATAPPIFHTDGTCTNASATIGLASGTNGFTQGHADIGSIVKLTGCGTAGADLTTYITGFTSTTSATVNDAASCGGGCPAGTGQVQIYQTVNLGGAPLFDPTYLNHTVLLGTAGADGQALVTTAVIYYSTTKFGINAAATNRSRGQGSQIYFGAVDYQQQLNWAKAWDFTTGAITTGTTALTTTAANELFPIAVCNTSINFRVQFTIKGAGPGGTDHNATCSSTLAAPGNAVTLSTAASTTVGPNAEIQIGIDGGSYAFRQGICINCYEEVDQFLNGHKFGSVNSTPAVANPPAVQGTSGFNFSPFTSSQGLAAPLSIGCFTDSGCAINFYAGRNKAQQFDFNFCDVPVNNSTTCVKLWRQTITAAKAYSMLVNELTVFSFAPGALRDFLGDTAVTSGLVMRFKGNSDLRNIFGMNADGSFVFGCTTGSSNCTTIDTKPNTAARTIHMPNATGDVCVTGSGLTACQYKRSAGCATAASLAATCTTTITWTNAFADTNYTPVCTGQLVTSGVPLGGGITAKSASAIDFQTVSATAAAAQYTNISCSAVHD